MQSYLLVFESNNQLFTKSALISVFTKSPNIFTKSLNVFTKSPSLFGNNSPQVV